MGVPILPVELQHMVIQQLSQMHHPVVRVVGDGHLKGVELVKEMALRLAADAEAVQNHPPLPKGDGESEGGRGKTKRCMIQ